LPSDTVENYLKAIYELAQADSRGEAAVGEVAKTLGVTPGSVSSMLKRLHQQRLAKYERYGGVQLTAKGKQTAAAVLRRHGIIETFLVRVLKIDWAEVHEEAERLEHAISDRVLEKLDAFLGHPAFDPHGEAIPDAQGNLRTRREEPLARCTAGQERTVSRVYEPDGALLRLLETHGLVPGAAVNIESVDATTGVVVVGVRGKELLQLSLEKANRVFVAAG